LVVGYVATADVPDGIVFLILSSLSAFVKKVDDTWTYDPPEKFHDADIIKAAKGQYINVANSNLGIWARVVRFIPRCFKSQTSTEI
jgi:hypothetical protein